MTDEQIALARRAVACRGWRWMPGMLTGDGFRCVWSDEISREWASPTWCENGMSWKNTRTGSKDLPDLTDPATLGCLLALVRVAYGDHRLACVPWRLNWAVDRVWMRNGHLSEGATEAEALVAALEAAP